MIKDGKAETKTAKAEPRDPPK